MIAVAAHALYEGTVHHRRPRPAYALRRRVLMPLLDLDRLDEAWRVHPLVSDRPGRPVRYDRRDYAGDPSRPLGDAVRDLVHARLGFRPTGRVRMLAMLRSAGWCFNPIVVHWCEDAEGRTVAQVLDVTNTPWRQRHSYVVDTRSEPDGWTAVFDKALHVSPFLPMDLGHEVRSAPPAERISLSVLDHDRSGDVVFSAGMTLARRPYDRAGLTRLLTRHALDPQRVTAAIYAHALRLRLAGARFHRAPTPVGVDR